MKTVKRANLSTLIIIFLKIFIILNTFGFSGNLVYSANYDMYEEAGDGDSEQINKSENYNLNDPFESINRKIFSFNVFAIEKIASPSIKVYKKIVGKDLHWMFCNLGERLYDFTTLLNSLLQFDFFNTGKTIATFSINMIFGVFGLFNPAKKLGIYRDTRRFGDTLAFYNVSSGFYVMIPIFGPSTARDALSPFVDYFVDPLSYNYFNIAKNRSMMPKSLVFEKYFIQYVERIDMAVSLHEQLVSKSLDPYNFVKNAYLQSRKSRINLINNSWNKK